MTQPESDVIVVGAGTAGAAVAAMCAEAGLSVHLLDRRPLDDAGARWVNDVTAAAFDTARLARPGAGELFGELGDGAFHLVAGWEGPRCTTRLPPDSAFEVDMRALVARLQRQALEHGARLDGEVLVDGPDPDAPRVLLTSLGRLRARLCVVDAAGLAGPSLLGQPLVPRRDICVAAHAIFEVGDRHGRDAFYARHAAEPGDALCFSGVAGGYSIVRIVADDDHVSVLTGSVPADGHPPGQDLLDDFVAREPWIGARCFGGHRAIPIRRAHDVIARGHTAAVGDAASQVFAAHGSGIGAGLVAARLLADTLVAGEPPERYGTRWQRRHGALFAVTDLFRRFSQDLTADEVEQLIGSGLLDESTLRDALLQRAPRVPAVAIPGKLATIAGAGRLGARMAMLGPRIAALTTLYAAYPGPGRALGAWSRTVATLGGL